MTSQTELKSQVYAAIRRLIDITISRDEGDEEFYRDYFGMLRNQDKIYEVDSSICFFVMGYLNNSIVDHVGDEINDMSMEDISELIIESYFENCGEPEDE